MIQLSVVVLAGLALAFPEPALTEGRSNARIVVIDPRPRMSPIDRKTNLDLLEDSAKYSALIRSILVQIVPELPLVPEAQVRKALGFYHRVEIFECTDDPSCILAKIRNPAALGVSVLLESSFAYEADGENMRFDLVLIDLEHKTIKAKDEGTAPRDEKGFSKAMLSRLAELFGAVGAIRLLSSAPPDSISIDDRAIAFEPASPVELGDIFAGTHQLRAERAGYKPRTLSVDVATGRTTDVQFGWEPVDVGSLESLGDPRGATVSRPPAGTSTVSSGGEPGFLAGFERGFFLMSRDETFRLNIGLETRAQLTFIQPKTVQSSALAQTRSVQLFLSGNLFQDFGFGLAANLAAESTKLQFAYGTIRAFPWLEFRVGQFLVPFGREGSDYFGGTASIERSIASDVLSPLLDVGVRVSGVLGRGAFSYSLCGINGSGPAVFDSTDQIDLVARISASPLRNMSSIFSGLTLGLSAQVGKQPFNKDGARTLFPFRAQRDAFFRSQTAGARQRYGGDLYFVRGPFSFQMEAIYERQERVHALTATGQLTDDPSLGTSDASGVERYGGYAEASFFVIGDIERGLQAVAKYERFRARSKGGPAELPSSRLELYTAGINVYAHTTVRFQINGILIDLSRSAAGTTPPPTPFADRTTWLILTQFQLWFV